jgi:two-component system, NtrC family, response regulator PilR
VQLQALPEEPRSGRPPTPVGGRAPEALAEQGFSLERYLEDIERSHVERALQQASGGQVKAAELLGLMFRQYRYLVKKYALRG